jgi:hypothetical protein
MPHFISREVLEIKLDGAGDGNRTRVFCLGSKCSAIELHPQNAPAKELALDKKPIPKTFPKPL